MVAIIEDHEPTKQHIFIFAYVLLFLWIYLFTKSIQFFGELYTPLSILLFKSLSLLFDVSIFLISFSIFDNLIFFCYVQKNNWSVYTAFYNLNWLYLFRFSKQMVFPFQRL